MAAPSLLSHHLSVSFGVSLYTMQASAQKNHAAEKSVYCFSGLSWLQESIFTNLRQERRLAVPIAGIEQQS
jgi:hypothetical protein